MAYEDPGMGSTSDGGSTTEVAKEQAGRVGQKATEAGGQVAQTTRDQAQNVVGEAKQQARDLVGEARSQVQSQAGSQRDRAVQGLHTLSDELEQMTQQGGQSGLATEVARQVSGRTRDLAGYLERHEPADLLAEIRSFARRRPVVFLAGAALAGVVAGRLTKGIVAGAPEDDSSRALTSGYPDEYGTSLPAVQSGEAYGTGLGTPAYPATGYESAGYQTPAYGTAGYAAPDDYATTGGGGFRAPDAGPVGSGYPAVEQGGYPPAAPSGYPPAEQGGYPPAAPSGYPPAEQGGYADPGPSGYPDAGQGGDYPPAAYPDGNGGAAYPPASAPGAPHDPELDPDQPPARGWTP